MPGLKTVTFTRATRALYEAEGDLRDRSGRYVRADLADKLLEACRRTLRHFGTTDWTQSDDVEAIAFVRRAVDEASSPD